MAAPRPPKTMTAADFAKAADVTRKSGLSVGEAADRMGVSIEALKRSQERIGAALVANDKAIRRMAPALAQVARARRAALPWWRLGERWRFTRQIRRLERVGPSERIQ